MGEDEPTVSEVLDAVGELVGRYAIERASRVDEATGVWLVEYLAAAIPNAEGEVRRILRRRRQRGDS